MPRWQYLTLLIKYNNEEKKFDWKMDARNRVQYGEIEPSDTSNPVGYLQDVLGADGWEMVGIEPLNHDYFGGSDMTGHWLDSGAVRSSRYWFKRPLQ